MQPTDKSLLDRLTEYNERHIPMHMPGHKRNTKLLSDRLPYGLDITEIDGFDNLHDMQGVLKDTAKLAARLYGAKHSFPLVGGSSCGILSAIHALAPAGSHVLMSRGSHKSVYNAVDLMGLVPHYLTADTDRYGIGQKITSEAVEEALRKQDDISLVILTSPTYEGVISDIKGISSICKKHGAHLLVDAAHGAHFGFSPHFADSAIKDGADVVVMSLHKTMPSLTQTALLHICSDRVDSAKIAESLAIFETSSPSYVLLSSIDACLRFIDKHGEALFSEFHRNLTAFYRQTDTLKKLSVIHYDDESKIIISTKNTALTGADLAALLRQDFRIETEMACADYVLAMTSICDKKESFALLAKALKEIDNTAPLQRENEFCFSGTFSLPEQRSTPKAARKKEGEPVALSEACGRECLEYVFAYPPGVPLIVPGEIVSHEFLQVLQALKQAKVDLKSTKGQISENQLYIAK